MTIWRLADCTLEVKVSSRRMAVKVIGLERDHLTCTVVYDGSSPFIGNQISVTSSELRRNLGFVDNFKEECPEYFL